MKFTAILLVCAIFGLVQFTSAQDCTNNPFFSQKISPDAAVQELSQFDQDQGVTLNNATRVFDVSKMTTIPVCPGLKTTGSCCSGQTLLNLQYLHTDFLKSVQAATADRFDWRVNQLQNAGVQLGSAVSEWVNVFSKVHGLYLKALNNVQNFTSNKTAIEELGKAIGDDHLGRDILEHLGDWLEQIPHMADLLEQLDDSNEKPMERSNITRRVLKEEIDYEQTIGIVGSILGLSKNDTDYLVEVMYVLQATAQRLPNNARGVVESLSHKASKDVEDKLALSYMSFIELFTRSFNVSLTFDTSALVDADDDTKNNTNNTSNTTNTTNNTSNTTNTTNNTSNTTNTTNTTDNTTNTTNTTSNTTNTTSNTTNTTNTTSNTTNTTSDTTNNATDNQTNTTNDANTTNKTRRILAKKTQTKQTVDFDFPAMLDARNIEILAGAIYNAVKNATTIDELNNALIKNNQTIYDRLNSSGVWNLTKISDVQAGGDLKNLKNLLVKLYSFSFKELPTKVVDLVKNKQKCLKTALQYHGYVRCLACDASAEKNGLYSVDDQSGTVTLIVNTEYADQLRKDCADFVLELSETNADTDVSQALNALATAAKAQKNGKPLSDAYEEAYGTQNLSLIENPLVSSPELDCDPSDSNCTWIQDNLINPYGVSLHLFLLEGTADKLPGDINIDDYIQFNKKGKKNVTPSKRRMLADDATDVASTYNFTVGYKPSNETKVNVLTTTSGFSTDVTLTVNETNAKNITANTTTDSHDKSGAVNTLSVTLIVLALISLLL